NLSGVALQDVKPIMASAIALFRRYRQVEAELSAAKTLLEERRACRAGQGSGTTRERDDQ
ncbi:MAG: hypothetical protein P4M15_03155, partial [Alphaproteobacteria bacterium]|nr:hypothetical protein [Alphaproteobacteria bacterium]